MKNIYEVFDEFELLSTREERIDYLRHNINKTLSEVLIYTFHPDYQWNITDVPHNYIPSQDTLEGISLCQLSTELRKLYMFKKGDPTAEKLTERRKNELLIILLESLEPREAEVVMGILRKDQGVEGLTIDLIKEALPNLL